MTLDDVSSPLQTEIKYSPVTLALKSYVRIEFAKIYCYHHESQPIDDRYL